MLNKPPFYNRTIRKIVVAFGTMFNEIFLQRYNLDGTVKKEIFKVPLSYGSKEKYLTRITSDPNFLKSVSTVVPRIAFEMTGIAYDSSRKQSSLTRNFAIDAQKIISAQYAPVPYDFNFSLSIFVRNTEDGTQILEQILPFFKPDYTLTIDFIPEMNQKYDMPIILNSVSPTTDYEGDMMTTRLILWELEFTVKGYIWPAVRKPIGLIGQFSNTANAYGASITNIYNRLDANANTQVAEVIVQSDPLGVSPDDEFGFSETINEYYSGYQPVVIINTSDSTFITSDSITITTDTE